MYLAFIPGKYSVVTKSGDCIGESELFTLYEFPIPIPVISGPFKVFPNQKSIAYQVKSQSTSAYKWEAFGNASITSNPNNSVIVVDFFGSGNAYIKVTETDNNKCINDTMITVVIDGSASITGDLLLTQSLLVTPNPVSMDNECSIYIPKSLGIIHQWNIYNCIGAFQQFVNTIEASEFGTSIRINTASMINGLYTIMVSTDKGLFSSSFIISK